MTFSTEIALDELENWKREIRRANSLDEIDSLAARIVAISAELDALRNEVTSPRMLSEMLFEAGGPTLEEAVFAFLDRKESADDDA